MSYSRNKNNKNTYLFFTREEGDAALMHDALFNFVPASFFEIGSALSILDHPGKAAALLNIYSLKIANIIERVYHSDLGNKKLEAPQNCTVKAFFDQKILKELYPKSDQLGRCLDKTLSDNWYQHAGLQWLMQQLHSTSLSRYTNLLMKMRTLCALGVLVRELGPKNYDVISQIFNRDQEIIETRDRQIKNKIRRSEFDKIESRARNERTPLIVHSDKKSKPLSSYDCLKASMIDERTVGLSGGNIWHVSAMFPKNNEGKEMIDRYFEMEKHLGRQGMPRLGQDIQDQSRPGILGESTMKMIPESFKDLGLLEKLQNHSFLHGSGVNRWQSCGTYSQGAWNHDFPVAGSHSGGTSDALLAMNCLSENSIFGDKEAVLKIGLLSMAFMNFGGYHSLIEVFPIVLAVANNKIFSVEVTKKQCHLYHLFSEVVHASIGGQAAIEVKKYLDCYEQSRRSFKTIKKEFQ